LNFFHHNEPRHPLIPTVHLKYYYQSTLSFFPIITRQTFPASPRTASRKVLRATNFSRAPRFPAPHVIGSGLACRKFFPRTVIPFPSTALPWHGFLQLATQSYPVASHHLCFPVGFCNGRDIESHIGLPHRALLCPSRSIESSFDWKANRMGKRFSFSFCLCCKKLEGNIS
jgi:hypothetical protein